MAKPVILHSRSWPTRDAATKYFQGVLYGYAVEDMVSGPEHDLLLRELLDRHPHVADKVGAGVDFFFIGKTDKGDKINVRDTARGFWIRRTDGSTVDFSFLTCIKQPTQKSDAKEAMRAAVEDRRMQYRAERFDDGEVFSDISGERIPTRDSAWVIYADPEWAQLTYDFAQSEGGWDKITVDTGFGKIKIGSDMADAEQEARWLAFYDAHANPSLATQSEASRRPRADEAAWSSV